MKKIVFALVVLLFAAPTWADVVIDANQVGDTNQVEISYEVTLPDTNLPRAFGLDITVTDGNIIACIPAMEGECTVSVRGFGIFPGTIDIDDAVTPPVVITYGSPVAPPGARGALGGLDTNGITIEMGSLYEGPNAPPSSGLLCTIVLDADANCIVRIAGNAARCGVEGSEAPGDAIGVVMEDPTQAVTINYVSGLYEPETGPEDCFDNAHPDYAEWVNVQKPNSWCYKYQCYGDADGKRNGSIFTGYSRVRVEDLNVLISGWEVPGYVDEATHPWIAADFDRTLNGSIFTGYSRVRVEDLNILVTNWESDALIPMATPNCGGDIDLTPP
jgi:hypothetical protein